MMTKTTLHILMLEDDPLDAELNKSQLRLLEEYDCILDWVVDKETYKKALYSYTPDIVLSDYNLPQYNGLEALTDLMAINPLIPFIFVTGTINEETAADTIKAGAWDYVVKDRLFRLPLAIKSVLKLKEERINTLKAEEQNRKLSMAIEQSPVLIVISNINGIIEYVNKKFTEITGYTTEEVIGKDNSVYDQNYVNRELYHNIWETLKSDKIWKGELQNKKKDGTLYWENASVSSLKNEEGKITHFISIKEDITARKKLELEIIQALDKAERSDKLKEAFLQNLSHEIRTPLNAIVGFSTLLNEPQVQVDQIPEFTSIILNSSNQLLSILTDILTVASIQTGQEQVVLKPVAINKVLDNLSTIFQTTATKKSLKLNIHKEIADESWSIQTDETKLTQILTNLLNNAFRFTHQGSITFGYTLNEDKLNFFVQDTGIGIAKESQSLIFERFRQGSPNININYGGTGLGLSICKSFAEMLNGNLSVYSEPNKGSIFTLELLYKPTKIQTASNIKYEKSINHFKRTILVAEDEEFNFKLIKTLLENQNYEILHVKNGRDAVEICKLNSEISLVLMDIKMPEMDGETAMLEIRKFRKDIPIIAQTAYALEHEKKKFLLAGFNDYLPKPINKKDLFEKLEKFF